MCSSDVSFFFVVERTAELRDPTNWVIKTASEISKAVK
jgi:hypothetical protein